MNRAVCGKSMKLGTETATKTIHDKQVCLRCTECFVTVLMFSEEITTLLMYYNVEVDSNFCCIEFDSNSIDDDYMWPNTIQYNTIQCNAMQCNAMQCNAMQCNAMQCNAMQCNAIQYNTIQYNIVYFQHRTQ